MRNKSLSLLFLASLALNGSSSAPTERLTAVGKVVDTDGKAIDHATVLVYSAGVKNGFNLVCPTCYVDCGKRTFTNPDGTFTIGGLSPNLLFKLLAVREGYLATFAENVDPANRSAVTVVVKKRASPDNPAQFVRGRVIDTNREPIRDVLVEGQGVRRQGGGLTFGPVDWIDPFAVTNENGEFEIAHRQSVVAMTLMLSPRGKAPKLVTESTGLDRKTITVTDGATIRGRLVQSGKPVAQVEVGLSTYSRMAGEALPEVRIGTNDDGMFTIANVSPGRIWYVYGKMDSLAPRDLAADIFECASKGDGEETNVGDIAVKPAYTVRGRVVLSDSRPIAPGMRINVLSDRVPDSQSLVLPPDGLFEFKGLGRGVYRLLPAVKGYELSNRLGTEILVDSDVRNLTLVLKAAPSPAR